MKLTADGSQRQKRHWCAAAAASLGAAAISKAAERNLLRVFPGQPPNPVARPEPVGEGGV